MKKWLATYGHAYDEYPNYFRVGDTFCVPMIELSHKNDIIYIYFSDYKINQICFKCHIAETDLQRNQINGPSSGIFEGYWCRVIVLAVSPVGIEALQNTIIESFGLKIAKIGLSNFGNLFISAADVTSNKICDYLDKEFSKCTNFKNLTLLNRQLSWVNLRLSRDSEGEIIYSKYMMPQVSHTYPSYMESKEWIGELVLGSQFCTGHFGPYKNLYKDGRFISYTQREMSFSYWLNGSPDGHFSCTIYELKEGCIAEQKLSWSGFEFAFRSLPHLLPFCKWLVSLNLQGIDISDLYNLAYVKLYSAYSSRERDISIIEKVYSAYNNCHALLTNKLRDEIINWFYDVFRHFPISHSDEPNLISEIRRYIDK